MKKLWFISLLILLLIPTVSLAQVKARGASSITEMATLSCATPSDGDVFFVRDSASNIGSYYVYDADESAGEVSPIYITPDDRAANCSSLGRWEMLNGFYYVGYSRYYNSSGEYGSFGVGPSGYMNFYAPNGSSAGGGMSFYVYNPVAEFSFYSDTDGGGIRIYEGGGNSNYFHAHVPSGQTYLYTSDFINFPLAENYVVQGNSSGRAEVTDSLQMDIFGGAADTASTAVYYDSNKQLKSKADVSDTELGYLDGVTSSIQDQIDGISEAETTAISTTPVSITSAYQNKRVSFTVAATANLDAASGFNGCVAFWVRDAAEQATINPDDADKIMLSGTVLSAGTAIQATGAGSQIVLCPTLSINAANDDGWVAWGSGWTSE